MNFSIIIFCYNEHGTLRNVAESIIFFAKNFSPASEIIIVDDGSSDGSATIADELKLAYPSLINVIHHPKNMGIGMALRNGYANAQTEYVCAIPADGQFDVAQLANVEPFADNTYYSFYRRETRYSFYRHILSWFNRLYNQHALGIYLRDVNWIKVYRLSQLKKVKPQLTSSLVESEICAKLYKLGTLPIEIPSDYLERKQGASKGGSIKTVWRALAETWKLFWVVNNFKA